MTLGAKCIGIKENKENQMISRYYGKKRLDLSEKIYIIETKQEGPPLRLS